MKTVAKHTFSFWLKSSEIQALTRKPGSPSTERVCHGQPRPPLRPLTRHWAPGSQVLPRVCVSGSLQASSTHGSSLNTLPTVANLTPCYSSFSLFSNTSSTNTTESAGCGDPGLDPRGPQWADTQTEDCQHSDNAARHDCGWGSSPRSRRAQSVSSRFLPKHLTLGIRAADLCLAPQKALKA